MSAPWPPPPSPAAPALACYRHPKVAAPVTCTRCDRPICTDCMVSAPVGWQCPACLKGAPAVRRMRDIQGGAFSLANGTPYLTYGIIATCVVAYLAQQLTDLTDRGVVVSSLVAQGEVWRVFTSGFLHGGVIHLLFNMLILFQLGSVLEGRLGRARYLGLYVLAIAGGSMGAMIAQPPTTAALGASGGVFGLMGAIVALSKRGRSPIESSVGGLLVINLVITFVLPGISIGGHIGGLVAGLIGGLLIRVVGEDADLRKVALTTAVLVALILALVGASRPVAEWRCNDPGAAASGRTSRVDPAQLERMQESLLGPNRCR